MISSRGRHYGVAQFVSIVKKMKESFFVAHISDGEFKIKISLVGDAARLILEGELGEGSIF